MGLRINTNIAAMNTARVLQSSTRGLTTTLERLSTGLRINRAKDDAAGLFIAENLNSVVRGARVSQRNAQDGISLVQTAEGALSQTSEMLQRMRELAVQSANGTYEDTNTRPALDDEVQQLRTLSSTASRCWTAARLSSRSRLARGPARCWR
jgi:flagellin